MTPEQQAAYINAQTAAALIEMQSMIAKNKERETNGSALAYGEEAFLELIERYGLHHNAILTTFGR